MGVFHAVLGSRTGAAAARGGGAAFPPARGLCGLSAAPASAPCQPRPQDRDPAVSFPWLLVLPDRAAVAHGALVSRHARAGDELRLARGGARRRDRRNPVA